MARIDEYHFVITLHDEDRPARGPVSVDGTILVAKGTTRQNAYRQVIRSARGQLKPIPENVVVLFFSLEPNDLGAAR